jgi:hypothetical protein
MATLRAIVRELCMDERFPFVLKAARAHQIRFFSEAVLGGWVPLRKAIASSNSLSSAIPKQPQLVQPEMAGH